MNQVDEPKTADSVEIHEGASADAQKVSFLPEQQARVQKLIDDAYRRAYAKASKRGPSDEVERLKAEVERLREDKLTSVILRALSRHNVVDAEEVVALVKDRIRIEEDGSAGVVGESGTRMINSSGTPMTVEEYLGLWLSERPHHLKPASPAGSGSRGAQFGFEPARRYDLGDPSSWRGMPREDLDRALREGINVHGSAGQVYRFKDVRNPFLEARRRKFQRTAQ